MKKSSCIIAALAGAVSLACASETRIWSLGDRADFEKGKLTGLALSSDGSVRLAPVFKEVFDSDSAYLWALAADSKGNVYAGGGGPGGPGARVYMIAPDGTTKTLAELDGLEVHAIAIDAKDRVFAATSPDGKVYRIGADGRAEVFYDPGAKYIWAMAFDSRGELIVATGDAGEVHRVNPDGRGSVLYKAPQAHARSLAIGGSGDMIIGTEPGGLIIRVHPRGEGFVLFQAAKPEITSVAVAKDGSIWASAVGGRTSPAPAQPSGAPSPLPVQLPKTPAAPNAPQQPGASQAPAAAPLSASTPAPAASAPGSEVYRIGADGFPKRVWSHARDIVYAIGFDPSGRPLLGAGNGGAIYRLDSDLVSTELVHAAPAQVTAICSAPGGRMWAATGNIGKVYSIGPGLEKSGTIESDLLDAGMFSEWGRLVYRGAEEGGRITVQTRSGNLDRTQSGWSPWSEPISGKDGGMVASPAARFLQWRATLSSADGSQSPVLDAVDVAYLQRNAAPVVTEIDVTPANYRFPAPAVSLSPSQSISLPSLGANSTRRRTSPVSPAPSTSMQYAKGFMGARWLASDDNGDSLEFAVYIRGEKEKGWKLLKDKLSDPQVSWDSTAFPDGDYRLKVVASDAPDNAPGGALTAEFVSPPLTIDNTPPEITGLTAARRGGKLEASWSARDALNVIGRAEYSINGGDWTLVEPVSRLSDSRDEDYRLTVDQPGQEELTLAVRVADEYENRSVAKIVIP